MDLDHSAPRLLLICGLGMASAFCLLGVQMEQVHWRFLGSSSWGNKRNILLHPFINIDTLAINSVVH